MKKVALVTDSTSSLPASILEKYKISMVPQVLIWGEKTYEDGIDIQPDEFYRKLSNTKALPTTSQVSVINMKSTFERLLAEGYEVLGVFISSKLSGTIQSAMQARDSIASGKELIQIVDSQTTSMSLGFQVLAAARIAADGANIQDCLAITEQARQSTGIFFMVDTLEFLHRGGRIGGAARFFGTALNLKPILTIKDGKVEAAERVRTKSKALDRVIELIAENTGGKSPIRLASLSANAESDANTILAAAAQQLGAKETISTEVSPVLGTHTGPGTVGLAYLTGL